MAASNQGMVLLQAFKRTQSVGLLNTSFSPDPEEELQDDSEPRQETPEQVDNSTPQELVELRIQHLRSRHAFLLNMQHFKKKEEDDGDGNTKETTSMASDELCELEAIQKELEELRGRREELDKHGGSSRDKSGQRDVRPTFHKPEPPRGGIYLLPPPQLTQGDVTPGQRVETRPEAERPMGSVVPVSRLAQRAAVTQCPSCQEVVFTETHNKVGDTVWMLCCLSSSIGCVAGCCLVPFLINRFKDTQHHCPQCQEHIHTFEPL